MFCHRFSSLLSLRKLMGLNTGILGTGEGPGAALALFLLGLGGVTLYQTVILIRSPTIGNACPESSGQAYCVSEGTVPFIPPEAGFEVSPDSPG